MKKRYRNPVIELLCPRPDAPRNVEIEVPAGAAKQHQKLVQSIVLSSIRASEARYAGMRLMCESEGDRARVNRLEAPQLESREKLKRKHKIKD